MQIISDLESHQIKFMDGGKTLAFTFESAFEEHNPISRAPWSGKLLNEHGFSVLGIISKNTDWYRSKMLHSKLIELRDSGFFERFSRIIFAGGSMGGFAALAFSSLLPGSEVFAISPQFTLDPRKVSFDKRWPVALKQDWSGDFSDGRFANLASEIRIVVDRHYSLDWQHIEMLLPATNVRIFNAPFLGHGLPLSFRGMGDLGEIALGVLSGEMSEVRFAQLMRKRKTLRKYQRFIIHRLAQSHPKLCEKLGHRIFMQTRDEYLVAVRAMAMLANGEKDRAFALMLDRPL